MLKKLDLTLVRELLLGCWLTAGNAKSSESKIGADLRLFRSSDREPDLSGFYERNAEVFGLLGQDKEGVDPGVLAPASPIWEVPDQEQDQLEPHSGPEMLVSTVTGKSSSMEQSLCNEFRPWWCWYWCSRQLCLRYQRSGRLICCWLTDKSRIRHFLTFNYFDW